MSHAGALVIVGKHKHLRLAGQASKCAGMENAVAVALETRTYRVGFFVGASIARPPGPGCGRRQMGVLELFTLMAQYAVGVGKGVGVSVCNRDIVDVMGVHRGRPPSCTLGHCFIARK